MISDDIFLAEKDVNHVSGFMSDRLAEADFVFAGATDNLATESKRYKNFKEVVSKEMSFHGYLYNLYVADFDSVSVDYSEGCVMKMIYENMIRSRLFEQWDLSYFQVNFESERKEVEAEIAKSFSGVDQVVKIYSSQYNKKALHFQILTSNTRYDRSLMMRLLNIEYEIGHQFKSVALSFDYIPKVYNSEDEIVVENGNLIYKKLTIGFQYERITCSHTTIQSQQVFGTVFTPIPDAI